MIKREELFENKMKKKSSFLDGLIDKHNHNYRGTMLKKLEFISCHFPFKDKFKKVDEKIRILKSDIRLIKLPLEQIKTLIKGYIKENGWNILKEEDSSDVFKIVSQNPVQSFPQLFMSRDPQIAKWHISKEKDYSRIRICFLLFDGFHHLLNRFLGFWLGIILLIIWIMHYLHNYNFALKQEIYRFFLLTLISGFVVAGAILSWVTWSKNYFSFINKFYDKLYKFSGIREIIISKGWGFPALLEIFSVLSFAIISIVIVFLRDSAGIPPLLRNLLWLLFLFALLCCFILGLSLFKTDTSSKLRLLIMGFSSGVIASIYSLLPVMNAFLVEHTVKLKQAVNFLGNNFAMAKDASYNLLMNQAHTAFISITFMYCFIGLVFAGFLFGLLNTAPELIKTRYWYNMNHPESDFSLSKSTNPASKLFNLSITAIWLMSLIAILPGIYFSLNALGFSFFGNSHFVANRFVSAMFNDIKTYFDYLSFKLGFALKGDIISRLMVGLYGLPVILFFMAVFIKKIKKFFIESQSATDKQILASLKQRVSKICSNAGVAIPGVILKNSPLAWSRVENSLLRGNVLMISNEMLKILNEQELDSIIAHEIWHFKRHIFRYNFLNLLSECTLFGRGFFAVALNTKQLEFEADDFALEWLKANGIDSKLFVKSLNKILIANSMSKYMGHENTPSISNDVVIKNTNKKLSFIKKIKLLYDFYFGDLIFSYIHPTMEERISRIERT